MFHRRLSAILAWASAAIAAFVSCGQSTSAKGMPAGSAGFGVRLSGLPAGRAAGSQPGARYCGSPLITRRALSVYTLRRTWSGSPIPYSFQKAW